MVHREYALVSRIRLGTTYIYIYRHAEGAATQSFSRAVDPMTDTSESVLLRVFLYKYIYKLWVLQPTVSQDHGQAASMEV